MSGFPELPAAGLVLWRLQGADQDQLWCQVTPEGDALLLTVYRTLTGDRIISEHHQDLDSLLPQADHLRDRCVSAGWQDVSDIAERV